MYSVYLIYIFSMLTHCFTTSPLQYMTYSTSLLKK